MDEEDRRRRLDEMRQNSRRLNELKNSRSDNHERENSDSEERQNNYEDGLSSIRKDMMKSASKNRNLLKYKS